MASNAKHLFATGHYEAAEKSFLTAAARSTHDPVDLSLQLSNASQCAINLAAYERAALHAQKAIEMNPRNFKAHYRLAVSYGAMPLPQNTLDVAKRCCDIAMANARAFALLKATQLDASLPEIAGLEVVTSHKHPLSARAADLLRLISNSKFVYVTKPSDILLCNGIVAVVPPNCQATIPPVSIPAHIVGLDGSATIHAFSMPHALFVEDCSCSAWGLCFEGSSGAMVCAVGDLALIECSLTDHNENGILVAEPAGLAMIAFCELDKCIIGIEVREGASATVIRSNIRNMRKSGISAYAGARSLVVEETLVEYAGVEGVQCHGPRATAVFDPFHERQFPQNFLNNMASAVADAAATLAQRNVKSALLRVILRNCCVRHCGTDSSQVIRSGVTFDQNATASLQGCLFTECRMASVYIKGGCNVSIQNCRIEQGHSGDAGVRVDINYKGKVSISQSSFVGKPDRAILELGSTTQPRDRAMMRVLAGAHSAPVHKDRNKFALRPRNAPSIESLRQGLQDEVTYTNEACSEGDLTLFEDTFTPGGAGRLYRSLGIQNVATEYPIGNTYGRDVLLHVDTRNIQKGRASVVLAACGDIRNVVETICGLETKRLNTVSFLLNDLSIYILARNIALLELACQLWPKAQLVHRRHSAGVTWLHSWGSIALTKGDHSAMHRVLTGLTKGRLPSWLSPLHSKVRNALICCWSEWASCERTLNEVRKERDLIKSFMVGKERPAEVHAALAAGLGETESSMLLRNAELLNGGGDRINPTLLSSGLQYNMYESSIFRAMDMRSLIGGDASKLYWAACEMMNQKGPVVARALHSGSLRVEILPGDLTFVLGPRRNVDAVDLSNALDYVSKPACLISAASCLCRAGGVLSMHTMVLRTIEIGMYNIPNFKEHFLRGAASEEFENILGLKALDRGNDPAESYGDGVNSQSRWFYQATEYRSRKPQDKGKALIAMMHAAKIWCKGSSAQQYFAPGAQIAAWPSAVAALKVVTAAKMLTESWSSTNANVVREMCDASPHIALFELELEAHAALIHGKEKGLVLGTFVLEGLENQSITGMRNHQILQLGENLGKDNENTVWLFDVFDCSVSRGVCEVLVRRDDIPRMSSLDVRLCRVEIGGALEGATQSITSLRESTLKIRQLSNSEMQTLRSSFHCNTR